MNAFTKKTLFAAIAGASVLGASGAAQAVAVSPNGMGEVLVYPYYTVKGSAAGVPYNTLLSIVNSTDSTKAVKIRFREGKASQEVLDFNIFLSPYDVWTGYLEPSAAGGTKISTTDTSCTLPAVVKDVEFRNFDYKGDLAEDDSLTRLQEGYFEVFEMATYASSTTTAKSAKHGSNGVPAACSAITNALAGAEDSQPSGGLSGTVSLVEPAVTGSNIAINATAFRFNVNTGYVDTGSLSPTFSDGEDWSVTTADNGDAVQALWDGDSVDATSATLMKNTIINEFVLDTATNSASSWVVTFPTKHFYVDNKVKSRAAPFQSILSKTGSCDEISIVTWNREEQGVAPQGPDFSPSPEADRNSLCWEANVINFNGKPILGSSNAVNITTTFQNGWMSVAFPTSGLASSAPTDTHKLYADSADYVYLNTGPAGASATSTTFTGLPVVGFAVQTFRPSSATSYAGTFAHKYQAGTPPMPNGN
jgi:hypothetical protein